MRRLLFLVLACLTLAAPQIVVAEDGAPSPVPQTGQTGCWDEDGHTIDCAGTGQDGEYQAGVSVDRRFTDNRDGTVTDNLTGLIWLQIASCGHDRNWVRALSTANAMADGICGLTDGSVAGDWRLPNVRELQSLVHYGSYSYPGVLGEVFSGVHWGYYWSSTSFFQPWGELAWAVQVSAGGIHPLQKYRLYYAWPVRGTGEGAPSPVPQTGRTECSNADGDPIDCTGTGQDGEYQLGVSVHPRFTVNGDGTVTDNLTGLTWLQDASCGYGRGRWVDALSTANTLADGSCGLTDGSVAGDWRLPNVRELQSLVHYGTFPTFPLDQPFSGVHSTAYYWSSTSFHQPAPSAWAVRIGEGRVSTEHKAWSNYVWPVRHGQSRIPVAIDIKPGSDTNPVNPRSWGVIPVAILGTEDFDVNDVDVDTLAFGPDGAAPRHNGHVEDVNDDGLMDLVAHFRTRETGIACGDTEATLSGELLDGREFLGTDSIETVGCNWARPVQQQETEATTPATESSVFGKDE